MNIHQMRVAFALLAILYGLTLLAVGLVFARAILRQRRDDKRKPQQGFDATQAHVVNYHEIASDMGGVRLKTNIFDHDSPDVANLQREARQGIERHRGIERR